MPQTLIMCRSLTYAQRASRVLEKNGIYAAVVKAPQGTMREGCSYGVRVREGSARDAVHILRSAGFEAGRTFLYQSDGSLREVAL